MEKTIQPIGRRTRTDYNAIVYFASFGYFRWKLCRTCRHAQHVRFGSPARCCRQRPCKSPSPYSSPARTDFTGCLTTKRKWTSASHQHASRRHQCASRKSRRENRLVQTKDLIEMRTPTHRDLPFSSFSRRRWSAPENFPIAYFLLSSVDTVCFRCLSFVCTLFKIVAPVKQKGKKRRSARFLAQSYR